MNYRSQMLLAFFCFSIALLSSGCGDSPNSSTPPSTADLIGKWTLTGSHMTGSSTFRFNFLGKDSSFTAPIDSTNKFTGNNDKAEFRSDSTYTLQSDEGFLNGKGMVRDSGSWSLSGNILHIRSHTGQTAKDISVGITGNNGTFTYAVNDSGVYQSMDLKMVGTFNLFATKN